MENTSNTSNKEAQHTLRIFADAGILSDTELTQKLVVHGFSCTSEPSDSALQLISNNQSYILKKRSSSYFCNKSNLLATLLLLSKNFDSAPKKKISDSKAIHNRILKHHKKLSSQSEHFEVLNSFLIESKNIFNFTRSLFTLKPLKKFQTIHMFVHEKGQANSSHYEITRESEREYSHSITDFNSLFQSIKKSKNRSYGQSTLKGFNLEILGTFLAHEFSLKNHNLILIVSRNDFLPQSKEEVSFFNFLATNLSSYVEILLEKKLILDKKEIIESALIESPYEIAFKENDKGLNSLTYEKYSLESGRQLKVAPLFKDVINQADIFHHERVSLLGELLNTLRHELSNPIFGLQLTTELLLMDDQTADNNEMLKEILKSIKRSQNIIENFTKLYKGTEEYDNVDVVALINEVFTLTKSESRHVQKTVNSISESISLHTNSTWLAQIFFNLIINSAQASKGTFEKGARFNIDISSNSGSIIFNIQDNGPGIPKEKVDDIFKAFYTTKEKGTGLGLAIASSLAQKLKGSLKCIYNDKGANFLLQLPYENLSH